MQTLLEIIIIVELEFTGKVNIILVFRLLKYLNFEAHVIPCFRSSKVHK